MKVLISTHVCERLEGSSSKFGRTQVVALACLVEWFDEQPEDLQHSIRDLHYFRAEPKDMTNSVLRHLPRTFGYKGSTRRGNDLDISRWRPVAPSSKVGNNLSRGQHQNSGAFFVRPSDRSAGAYNHASRHLQATVFTKPKARHFSLENSMFENIRPTASTDARLSNAFLGSAI
jgi:hypothetical protein